MENRLPHIIIGLFTFAFVGALTGNFIGGVFAGCMAVGIFIFSTKAPDKKDLGRKRFEDKHNQKISYKDYTNYTLLLAAVVIKSDGRIYPKERELVRQYLSKNFEAEEVTKLMNQLEHCLDKKVNMDRVCMMIRKKVVSSTRIQLLHFLIRITCSDGILTNRELETLIEITKKIGLGRRTLESLLSMFSFRRIHSHEGKKEQKQRSSRPSSSRSSLSKAHTILELDPGATVDEIKKAYRRLAKIHHPDRVAHLGESHTKIAKEKFQKIVGAYERLKAHHKF